MKESLSRIMGLLFLVSSVVASERSSSELDSQLCHAAGGGSVAACKKLLSQGAAVNGRGRDGTTPLYAASGKAHCEVVKLLLGNKAQIEAAKDNGATPLYVASMRGHGEVVQLLLKSKAQIDVACTDGVTPLFIASQNGHCDVVKLLLVSNAQVDAARNTGATPLFMASQNGHYEVVKLLLVSNAQVDSVFVDCVTPLMIASQKDHADVCQLLIDSKAAINSQTKKNRGTALHTAVLHNHINCVTVLLKAGADVTVRDERGDTPLEYATNQKNRELRDLLSRYEPGTSELDSQLRHAAGGGSAVVCKKLLSQGAAVNGRGRDGTTPLYAASVKGHCEVVKLLLGNKAQTNKARDDFTTPLYAASQEGHGEVVKLLLGNKAQVDAARDDGTTPLFIASQEGHGEVVKLLHRSKAQIDAALDTDVTPLIIASQKGHDEICQLLLDSKAAINKQTKKGKRTALHAAVQHNHLDCVTVLLNAGVDVTVCDVKGDTPFVYATTQKNWKLCDLLSRYEAETKELDSQLRHTAASGNVAACEKLLTQGAKLNGRGQGGVTPLYAASQKGHSKVIKFLLESKSQVDAACDDGETALFMASREDYGEIVRLLLEGNARVDAACDDGATPLFVASREGYIEVVKLLLGSNARVDSAMKDGSTPLFIASQKGHGEVCQLLLYSKAAIDTQTKEDKKTALHTAVLHKHLNCVTLLLKANADVTVCDVFGDTPLVYATNQKNRELCDLLSRHESGTRELDSQLRHAAVSGNVAVCEKLLTQGAALNSWGQDGVTPLYAASQEGHDEVVRLLLGSKAQVDAVKTNGATPLYIASQEGHGKVVKLLLGSKAQVDGTRPSLYIASKKGHGEVVKLLLGSKALVDGSRADGVTPLFIASQCGHGGVCQLLVDSKAAIDTQTKKDKKTALHTAVLHNYLNCVAVLLNAGADVDVCDEEGDTPIAYAAKQRNRRLCILLSRYGAEIKVSRWRINKSRKKLAKYVQSVLTSDEGKISSIDSDYQSIDHLLSSGQGVSQYSKIPSGEPLYYANVLSTLHTVAQEGDCEKLEMIFGFGVPVDLLSDEGYTALHLAVLKGHYEMCSQLLEYGADRRIKTPTGETPLQIAQRVGHTDIFELLKAAPAHEQEAVSSTDADYQTFNRLVRAIKGVPDPSAIPSSKPKEYEKILSTLHSVAQNGDCDRLEMIFGFGVPVDQLNADGFTALHLAVLEGHYAMCVELLKYGADKNIKTPEEETPLQIAQRIGNKKLIELLDSVSS